MKILHKTVMLLGFLPMALASCSTHKADVVIYGGTSSAVIAAVEVVHSGKSVIVVSPDKHLGGMTSGGLGYTDSGNTRTIGGLARNFYHRVWKHYSDPASWVWQEQSSFGNKGQNTVAMDSYNRTMWVFEPHVAEGIFEDLISENNIKVLRDEWLDRENGVEKKNRKIISITTLSGKRFKAKVFIDATYEGDLMAAAGVSYNVGRESSDTYGEDWNGVQTGVFHHRHHFKLLGKPIDPYVIPGDPSSGLLPRISPEPPGDKFSGDGKIQAYCYRMCLTDNPDNMVPFQKPEGYDPSQYELLLRIFDAGWREWWQNVDHLPNLKTDTNNHGPFSTDNIGMNYRYPDASYKERKDILKEHENYQKGLIWFVCNDPRVPQMIRDRAQRWGLAKDEFTDNGNWPHQIYIREARRMSGEFVMTENELLGRNSVPNPIGMGSYPMDSHNVQRYVSPEGFVHNEGDIGIETKGYGISYGSLIPKKEECTNLLVPVCASASHIAYGSIRMEPVFMILGQSAAVAACLAIEEQTAVQDVTYSRLAGILREKGQILSKEDWIGTQGIKSDNRKLEEAYRLALRTVDMNIHDGILFAGSDYGGEWTRDISINAWNGGNLLNPSVMRQSLWNVTENREKVGHQYWDKALWLIAAYDHYKTTGDKAFLKEAYSCSVNTISELEQLAYNPATGLFTGPSVFNDGIAGYPEHIYDPEVISSYVLDHKNSSDISTLSTNCMYYGAYLSLNSMAETLGLDGKGYTAKARALKESIVKQFYRPEDSRLIYMTDHEGQPCDYQEALGIGYAVMFGILDRQQAAKVVANAFVTPYGIPSIYPDFGNFSNEKPGRHNNLVWPMTMGFFAQAAKDSGNDSIFFREMNTLAGLALDKDKGDGNFREIYSPVTGRPEGGWQMLNPKVPDMHWCSCSNQVWSATAFLRMVYYGLAGISLSDNGISFSPAIPEDISILELTGLHYNGSSLDLIIEGNGSTTDRILLDGNVADGSEISKESLSGGRHTIKIIMK